MYARAFVQYFGGEDEMKKGLEIHPDYMECLKRYGWHEMSGNCVTWWNGVS